MKAQRWPSETELKSVRRKLVLPPDASALDKAKYEVCKKILVHIHRKELTQRELAAKMEIPETRVSEIVHYRIGKFTLDRLIGYHQKINPKDSFQVALRIPTDPASAKVSDSVIANEQTLEYSDPIETLEKSDVQGDLNVAGVK